MKSTVTVRKVQRKLQKSGKMMILGLLCALLAACAGEEQIASGNITIGTGEEYASVEPAPEKQLQETQQEEQSGVPEDEVQSGQETENLSGQEQTVEIIGRTGMNVSELLTLWDWSGLQPVYLEQVLADLEGCGIRYEGYYNVSGERLDMALEDGTKLLFLLTERVDALTEEERIASQRYELMLKGEEFNANGFQEHYLHAFDVISEDYFYPELLEEVVEDDLFWRMNQTDLSIVRNQFFAKYGRIFKDDFLNAVFSQKTWYEPMCDGAEMDANMHNLLTDVEMDNLLAIMANEEQRNFRKESGGRYNTAQAVLSGSWIDLDNDGVAEKLTYTNELLNAEYEHGSAYVKVWEAGLASEVIQPDIEGYSLHDNCYVITMGDGTKLIVVAADGMSADYSMKFYRYTNHLTELGTILSHPQGLRAEEQILSAAVETYHLQCQPVLKQWEVTGDAIEFRAQDYYLYTGNTAVVLEEVKAYSEKDTSGTTDVLQIGEEICILGGDLSEWVEIDRLSTGERFWLRVDGHDVECADGTMKYSGECMDGLHFYG